MYVMESGCAIYLHALLGYVAVYLMLNEQFKSCLFICVQQLGFYSS